MSKFYFAANAKIRNPIFTLFPCILEVSKYLVRDSLGACSAEVYIAEINKYRVF
jgi:hypothetical protein